MANLIDDLDHSDMHKIIVELKSEPCLYDPNAQYYKNAKKRKEAYVRITARVNEGATKQYTVEDIMANVKNLRQKYRKYRNQRMHEFSLNEELPTAQKWWVMLHRYVKDENKITENILTDASESTIESERRFDYAVKRYMEAEKRYMAQLPPDEDTAAEEKDDSDGDAPAAKKSKTDKSDTKRKPRYIEDVDDDLMDYLVYVLRRQPCLCDPSDKFYKNNNKKEEAYQRVAEEMNEEYGFDGEYSVEDIKENIKIIRKYYREHRDKRLKQFEKKAKLPRAEKWWRSLHSLLLDETKIELTTTKKQSTKAKMDKLITNYLKAEDVSLENEDDSDS